MRSIKLGLLLLSMVCAPLALVAGDESWGPERARRPCPRIWPQARGYANLLYDPNRQRDLLVGGQSAYGWTSGYPGGGGLWALDAADRRWSYIADVPVDGMDQAIFDSREDKVILYKPFQYDPSLSTPLQLEFMSEIWVYDFRTKKWTNPRPPETPPPGLCQCGGQLAYDSRAGQVVMFGGIDLPALDRCFTDGCDYEGWFNLETNDTYDVRANRWTKLPRPADEGQLPPRRNSHALTYDSGASRVLLFGGGDWFADSPPDVWALDLRHNSWTRQSAPVAPPGGMYFKLAYDAASKKTVYFGGLQYTSESEVLLPPETWAYDFEGNSWELMSPPAAPGARAWHAWTWDGKIRSFVMFGGGVDREHFTDELWTYRLAHDHWQQVPKR